MDNENPSPFQFQTPPPIDPPAAGNGKKKRGPRRSGKGLQAPKAKRAAAPPASGGQAPVNVRRAKKAQRAPKVDLSAAIEALAGLQPDDSKLLTQMVQALNGLPKPARSRIVVALGKIFA